MQGTISFDGTLSGGITGGGGGGSEVVITPVLTEGEKIAEYTIDGEAGSLYAPESVEDVQLNTSYPSEYHSIVEDGIAKLNLYPYAQKVQVANDIGEVLTELRGVELDVNSLVAHFPDKQDKLTAGQNITIDPLTNTISASGGSSWDYSTTEVNTGQKWIDGKDIYCRVFNLPDIVLNDNNWNNNVLGTSNIHIIKYEGFIGLQGYDINLPLNYYRQNTEFITTILSAGYSDINIRPNMNAGVAVKGLNCTIFYTKNS